MPKMLVNFRKLRRDNSDSTCEGDLKLIAVLRLCVKRNLSYSWCLPIERCKRNSVHIDEGYEDWTIGAMNRAYPN